MTATLKSHAPFERTEHPHVIKSDGVMGGQPRIDDQRISVLQIYDLYQHGSPIAEILASYPSLTPAQVLDALSYAHDHPDEMAHWTDRLRLRSLLHDHDMAYIDGRLVPRRALATIDISPGSKVYTWETLPEDLNE